ncbi:SIR2 family protein [Methylomicrobium sp. RS1]|uniref:SIR2 family protein n=1 Tax=Candidatus Methylomicrobium oryzae TaxID=2802053 RepID=UPI001920F634|nr:SIR2 family protein [Methylomicrobium sp. RS1]MBL1265850.1 SIR2 family protein [Methylomicrobium sp. RS1]
MSQGYEAYQKTVEADISTCLEEMCVQPILFIGSGISQRYFDGPNWDNLLELMAQKCPLAKDFAYYRQKHSSLIDAGTDLAELYREWAWGEGRSEFPANLFSSYQPADIYIKHKVAEYFEALSSSSLTEAKKIQHAVELDALRGIRPHAIITTNYDRFLENLFPEYTSIIGQSILRANYTDIGEILKIHGCSSAPESVVLTRNDYNDFNKKKKYLSAKLLTFFAEHPLVFLGYKAEDPNVKEILSDIDEILSAKGELIPNIYLVEWDKNASKLQNQPYEVLLSVGDDKTVRIKRIVADDFEWIYKAFSTNDVIEAINPKVLRALLARTYTLVRQDIPRRSVDVDYQTLEHALSDDGFAKLYGITTLDDPSTANAKYPYSLTQVGEKLGYPSWHKANQLLEQLQEISGKDIKSSDNKYHLAIKSGNKSFVRKYSDSFVDLLREFRDGATYNLQI